MKLDKYDFIGITENLIVTAQNGSSDINLYSLDLKNINQQFKLRINN